MSTALEDALNANRGAIESGLREAELELRECLARCADLEALISRAHLILGTGRTAATPPSQLTLHEAMQLVLRENGGAMAPVDLTRAIRDRGLYRKRDGEPAGVGQIHARVHNYPHLFGRHEGTIRLQTKAR